jgi:hypothetical protein
MTVAVPVRLQGGSSECNRPAPPDEDESGSDEDNSWHELLKVHVPDGANQAAKVSLNQSHHPAGATNAAPPVENNIYCVGFSTLSTDCNGDDFNSVFEKDTEFVACK